MTENVIVSIIENHENSTGNSEEKLLSNIDSMENLINNTSLYDSENNENNENTTMAIQIEYELNYTVKQLKYISEYYNIDTRKLKKSEIIDNIILFEMEDENQTIIYTRKRLWYFVEELKNDHFFDNIIFPF